MSRTYARRCGKSKDGCDTRGRWKGKKRQGGVYEDAILPYPDAAVAAVLCIGGPIKYCLKEGCGITNPWIQEHVIPNIVIRFETRICNVLGRALLWACFDPDASAYGPQSIVSHAGQAYQQLQVRLPDGKNPVKRIRLHIDGDDDQVLMTEIGEEDGRDPNAVAAGVGQGGGGGGVGRNDALALHAELRSLRGEDVQLNDRIGRLEAAVDREFARQNGNINRSARWPARPAQNLVYYVAGVGAWHRR